MELKVRNVNEAVSEGLWLMKTIGEKEQSRNGEVIAIPEPLMTTYRCPTERVLFWPDRDANPMFHLLESLWMLAGRDDVEFVQYFNSRMGQFSDNATTLNGAYGHRWRSRFGVDQLYLLVDHMTTDRETRRAVLTMWGVDQDLRNLKSKDVCCNTQAYFDLRGGVLNMTVTCRSNDMIWGAYGANAVHFSVLQEFMAHALGAPVGVYRQFSNNMHLYTDLYDFKKHLELPPDHYDFNAYLYGVDPRPMFMVPWRTWLFECGEFCKNPFKDPSHLTDPFFREVAWPMAMIVKDRKEKFGDGRKWADRINAADWAKACMEWIERRDSK